MLPQLIARATELAKFERAASDAGAGFVHVLLLAGPETCHARFEARGTDEPHLRAARQTVDEAGGAEVVAGYRQALVDAGRRSAGHGAGGCVGRRRRDVRRGAGRDRGPQPRVSNATHSTWCVIGNRSKARSSPSA